MINVYINGLFPGEKTDDGIGGLIVSIVLKENFQTGKEGGIIFTGYSNGEEYVSGKIQDKYRDRESFIIVRGEGFEGKSFSYKIDPRDVFYTLLLKKRLVYRGSLKDSIKYTSFNENEAYSKGKEITDEKLNKARYKTIILRPIYFILYIGIPILGYIIGDYLGLIFGFIADGILFILHKYAFGEKKI